MIVCGKINVPVRFDDIYIELDLFVVKDGTMSYNIIIGRNAIEHTNVEIITDCEGSRIRRKILKGLDLQVNTLNQQNYFHNQSLN